MSSAPTRVIALLGRRDEPTDAVEEYCRHLGSALAAHGFALELRRVSWDTHHWRPALDALRSQAADWRGTWVLVQYTALAWSSRGFPQRFLSVLSTLRKRGARVAVVYHDAEPYGGARLADRFRRAVQVRVMRAAASRAEHVVFTVPCQNLSWPVCNSASQTFIPVGANLPWPIPPQDHTRLHAPPTVGVFSITGGEAGARETRNIVAALRLATRQIGPLRLLVFGRQAETREAALRSQLRDVPVEIAVEGVLDDAALFERFAASDVLLFIRGVISSRRSSAIAGIACGLPLVALCGRETAAPITDAGVLLVDGALPEATLHAELAAALAKILTDHTLRSGLVTRSRAAQEQHFAWPAIAARYAAFLRL